MCKWFNCYVQITCEQVKEFTKSISTFHDKFSEEGPGTVGSDLDEGIYIHTYIHTCIYIHAYICMYVSTYTYMYVTYVCKYSMYILYVLFKHV